MVGPGAVNYTADGVSKGVPSITEPGRKSQLSQQAHTEPSTKPTLFVAGGLAVDFSCDFSPLPTSSVKAPALHTSNPAKISQSLGGVAHNVARAASLMGGHVRLCSAVGDDLAGKAALEALALEGLERAGIKTRTGSRTAQYIAINDLNKDLVMAVMDMSILEDRNAIGGGQVRITEEDAVSDIFDNFWLPQVEQGRPSHIILDANWNPAMLARWLEAARVISAHVSFEPVSTAKSVSIFHLPKPTPLAVFPNPLIHLATPNALELSVMHATARERGFFDSEEWWAVIDALGIPSTGARAQLALTTSPALVDAGVPQQSIQLLPFIPSMCTKLGSQGVLLTQLLRAGDPRLTSGDYAPYILSRCNNETEETLGVGGIYMRLFPAAEMVSEADVVSVNGVGDTFMGTIVAGLAKRGRDARVEDVVDVAQKAAVMTLKSNEAVSPELGRLRSGL